MWLIPVGLTEPSSWTDGGWFEKPGHPCFDGCWIHVPCKGQCLPEFHLVEDHDKIKDEPFPELYVGSGPDCHVRLDPKLFPARVCRFLKRKNVWYIETLHPNHQVSLQGATLETGRRSRLNNGEVIGLPALRAANGTTSYRIEIDDSEDKDTHPNRYPTRFPCRSSLLDAPEAPEELRRLAWQTDQMRRRSENDQVRVADWSNFSQYVKQHYLRHGIQCTSWKETGRGTPWDPKPPSFPARPLPSWICELLQDERPVSGVGRPLPFASSLRASGMDCTEEPTDICVPVVETQESVAATPPEETEVASAPVEVNPHLLMSIHDWLESIDDSLFMLQYYEQIISNFDSLKQIHDIYFHAGRLDAGFFAAAGITKLGHKRIIEKWFREKC